MNFPKIITFQRDYQFTPLETEEDEGLKLFRWGETRIFARLQRSVKGEAMVQGTFSFGWDQQISFKIVNDGLDIFDQIESL